MCFFLTRLGALLSQPFDHEQTNYIPFKSFLNFRHSFTWEYFSMPRNPSVTLSSVIYNRAILKEPLSDGGASRTKFLGSTRQRQREKNIYTHTHTNTHRNPRGDLARSPRASFARGLRSKGLREKSPKGCVSNFYGAVFFTVSFRQKEIDAFPLHPLLIPVDRRTFRSH